MKLSGIFCFCPEFFAKNRLLHLLLAKRARIDCPEFSIRLFTWSHRYPGSSIKQPWDTSETLSVSQWGEQSSGTIKMADIKRQKQKTKLLWDRHMKQPCQMTVSKQPLLKHPVLKHTFSDGNALQPVNYLNANKGTYI